MTDDGTSEPDTLNVSVGGIVSTRVANVQVVHVARPGRKRGGVSHEALRLRLTLERWTVEGRYLTMTGIRSPGSVEPRARSLYWQAVVPMPALQAVRKYWAQQNRAGRRKGRKERALVRAAEVLHEWRAPVNRYTLQATMALLTVDRVVYVQTGRGKRRRAEVRKEPVNLSHRWIQAVLSSAGWRTLRPWEYPKTAPHFAIANWVPGEWAISVGEPGK